MTSDELSVRTMEVRARLAAAAGASRGRGRGYGAEAQSMAVEHARALMASGKSVRQAARAIGVQEVTLRSWMSSASEERAPGAFAAVQVMAREPSTARTLRLVLPGGARIEGLDIASAAALARALG